MEAATVRTDRVIPVHTYVDLANPRITGTFTMATPVTRAVDATSSTKASAVNPAFADSSTIPTLFRFDGGAAMSAGTRMDIPTGWVAGTTVVPYVRILKTAAGPGTVSLTMSSRPSCDGAVVGALDVDTVVTDVSALAADTPLTIRFPAVPTLGMTSPCDFTMQLVRNGGVDTFAGNVVLLSIGATVTVDRLGA